MRTLVQYAGDDRHPKPKPLTIDSMFRLGMDTFEIASQLELTEAVVLRRLNIARSERLKRDRPYPLNERRPGRPVRGRDDH